MDATPQKVQVVLYGITSQKLYRLQCACVVLKLYLNALMQYVQLNSACMPSRSAYPAVSHKITTIKIKNDGGGFGNAKNEHI